MDIKTVSDAVSAASYLRAEKVLCDHCGLRMGEWANQYYLRCEVCRPPHGEFSKVKTANVFHVALCDALVKFVGAL